MASGTRAPSTIVTVSLTGQTDFNIPFEYLARKFVVVTLLGSDRKVLTLNSDYRFVSKTVISLANPTPSGYTKLELRRVTSATERLVDFHDGSILRAYDLNLSQIQTLHVAEEARDSVSVDGMGISDDFNLDARNRRIINLAPAVSGSDAVPLGQVVEREHSAWNSALEAEASAHEAARIAALLSGTLYKVATYGSILEFGAKGDGVTDDTEAFKKAIASSYSVIHVPKGVYIVSDTLVIPTGMSFIGDGTDYWDTYRPQEKRLLKSVAQGTHILFKGTGPKRWSAINLAHQQPAKSTGGVSFNLLDFTNGDSVAGRPATPKMFSVGIILQANATLSNLRVCPWFNGIDGYNDFTTRELGSDWDIGIWAQGANEASIAKVQCVGYWRMAGCLITENDGTYEQWGSNPERLRIVDSGFQGVRGLAIRNGAQWRVFSNTDTTIEVEWNQRWTLTAQDTFRIIGSAQFYKFTGYTFANNRVTLTGVTPNLPANVSALRSPSMGNNLSGATFENSYCASFEHSSRTPADVLGLPVSGAMEINGFPLRGMKFMNSKFQTTWDKLNTIFADCRDMKFVACQFENGALIAYNQTDSSVGFTENLRMVNTYADSGTLDRTLFTPREYFNDYDTFPTAFTDGTFTMRPPLWNMTGITMRFLSSDGKMRAEFKDDGQDSFIRTGRNFTIQRSDGTSLLNIFGGSGNMTTNGHLSVGGDVTTSSATGYVGSVSQPFNGIRLRDQGDGVVKLVKLVNGVLTIVNARTKDI
ncbi:MAG: phage tail fiber protein [Cetobacterium sp.]